MTEERRIEFNGTGFQALGWGLLSTILSLIVIPAVWGAVFCLPLVGPRAPADSGENSGGGRGRGDLQWSLTFGPKLPPSALRVSHRESAPHHGAGPPTPPPPPD